MSSFKFADRYAEASLAPTAEMIKSRQESASRIVENIRGSQVVDLVDVYYGGKKLDINWFRDEFAKEDPTFSLINNEREVRVLSTAVLGQIVASGDPVAILAIIAGSVSGHRVPVQAEWLLRDAKEAHGSFSVSDRAPSQLDIKITPTIATKLTEEITDLAVNDWAGLLVILGKIRSESQNSAKTTTAQILKALEVLKHQAQLQREEAQMLWWLVGGHSRCLERSFSEFAPMQAAIIGGIEMGELTSTTHLGPVAAPAILERVVALAKRPKGVVARDLASAVDGLERDYLGCLLSSHREVPARLAPVTTALMQAKSMGNGVWHQSFSESTGLDSKIIFEPGALASQAYYENLLGQVL
ncbi:GTPase-associated system all-helical protein GASH [Camelimonas lactis]|uniref:GTPase-associated system helical domain-containing protein n=1 Tax=Camelimonas lactis TaxID=659006 RepID=A0A4R2GGG4_9HYPH|nr:GTPase-associated system all-helical protein GASH [Camelimonas lactis]TCO07176.1 hypothetical protein EV666_1363 [Camelimonas lactis]